MEKPTSTFCGVKLYQQLASSVHYDETNLHYLRTISECKCPEHIDQEPYKLLTFPEIRQQLYNAIHELNMWCCRNIHQNSHNSKEIKALLEFSIEKILSLEDNTLLSLVSKVEQAEKK